MLPEFLQPFVGFLSAHPYLFIFVGLLFVGELVLLPAIYLSTTGRLELSYVVGVAIAATVVSDLAWYVAGRTFPATALRRLPGRGTSKLVTGLNALFASRGAQVLFLSKFVYGTRVIAQLLAGLHRMPLRIYLLVNTLAVATITLSLSGIALLFASTAQHYADIVHSAEIAFLAFVLVAATGFLSAALIARRRWSQL